MASSNCACRAFSSAAVALTVAWRERQAGHSVQGQPKARVPAEGRPEGGSGHARRAGPRAGLPRRTARAAAARLRGDTVMGGVSLHGGAGPVPHAFRLGSPGRPARAGWAAGTPSGTQGRNSFKPKMLLLGRLRRGAENSCLANGAAVGTRSAGQCAQDSGLGEAAQVPRSCGLGPPLRSRTGASPLRAELPLVPLSGALPVSVGPDRRTPAQRTWWQWGRGSRVPGQPCPHAQVNAGAPQSVWPLVS